MEPLVLNETADPPFHSTHANLCSCDRSVCQQDLVHLRHCRYAHRPEFGASYLNSLSLNMGIMPATSRNRCDDHRSLCPLVPNQQSQGAPGPPGEREPTPAVSCQVLWASGQAPGRAQVSLVFQQLRRLCGFPGSTRKGGRSLSLSQGGCRYRHVAVIPLDVQ